MACRGILLSLPAREVVSATCLRNSYKKKTASCRRKGLSCASCVVSYIAPFTPPPLLSFPSSLPPSPLPTWSMLSLIGRMESLTDASSMDGCIASSGRVNSTFRHTYMCGGVIDTTWWYMQTCVQTGMGLMKTTSSAFRTLTEGLHARIPNCCESHDSVNQVT